MGISSESPIPAQLDSLYQCAYKALTAQDKLSLEIFFAYGGTMDKIASVAKELQCQGLHIPGADFWADYEHVSSLELELKVIRRLFLESKTDKLDQALHLLLELSPILDKVMDQFNQLFKEQPENQALAERMEYILTQRLQQEGEKKLQAEVNQLNAQLAENKGEVLKEAILKGDLDLLKLLMKFPDDLMLQDKEGNTPLVNAAKMGKEEICRFLIEEKGALIDAPDKNNGSTPLMWACLKGHLSLAQYLLDKGANINAKNLMGATPICFSTHSLALLKFLISRGANIHDKVNNTSTLLHLAAGLNHRETIPYFISQGLDVNAKDRDKLTPLHHACYHGHVEIVKALLEKSTKLDINAREDTGFFTPLHYACNRGHVEVVRTLLEASKVDVNAKTKPGRTPLHYASSHGYVGVVEALLKKANKIDVNAQDKNGYTSLHIASYPGHVEVIKVLLEKASNLDVNVQDKNGFTPLHIASCHGRVEVIKVLLEKASNLDVNAQDKNGFTPLHTASYHGRVEVIKALLEKDSILNFHSRNLHGYRPIHEAFLQGREEIIKKLLSYEKNKLFPSFFIEEKMMCHRFGTNCMYLSETGKQYKLEGLEIEYAYLELQKSLKNYMADSSINETCPEGFNWSEVLQIFSQFDKKNVSKALSNDIICLLTGWASHSTGLLVCQSKGLLIKCNRGAGARPFSGMRIYQIGRKEKLKEVLQKLIENERKPEGKEFFLNQIDQELELKEITAHYIPYKDQHSGNCAWASSKLNVRGIIYLTLLNKGYMHDQAAQLSQILYKAWTNYDRFKAVQKFISSVKEMEKSCHEKGIKPEEMTKDGIIPHEVLKKVFFKSIRSHRTNCLELLISHFPELLENK